MNREMLMLGNLVAECDAATRQMSRCNDLGWMICYSGFTAVCTDIESSLHVCMSRVKGSTLQQALVRALAYAVDEPKERGDRKKRKQCAVYA